MSFLWYCPPSVGSIEFELDLENMYLYCIFTLRVQRLGGVLNDSFLGDLPCDYNRDVHPSCLRLREAAFVTGELAPASIAMEPALMSNCRLRLLPLVPAVGLDDPN